MCYRRISLILTVLVITGCSANYNSIHHRFHPGGVEAESMSIDAKQRVVIATHDSSSKAIGADTYKICAEPSPDALSAFATSIQGNADLSSEKIQAAMKLQGALAQTETASYVGLRTQTIQLLRDGMYRLCEGYMSGALDKNSYNRLQRRYQNLMMGLLSIEQLTGAIVAPQVAISAGSAKSNDELSGKLEESYKDAVVKRSKSDKILADATEKMNEAKKELDAAEPGTDLTKLEASLAEKQTELKKAQEEQANSVAVEKSFSELYEKSIYKSNDSVSTAGGTVQQLQQHNTSSNGSDYEQLSKAVHNIVDTVVSKSFSDDECYLTMSDMMQGNGSYQEKAIIFSQGVQICTKYKYAEQLQNEIDLSNKKIDDNKKILAESERKIKDAENKKSLAEAELKVTTSAAEKKSLKKSIDAAEEAVDIARQSKQEAKDKLSKSEAEKEQNKENLKNVQESIIQSSEKINEVIIQQKNMPEAKPNLNPVQSP